MIKPIDIRNKEFSKGVRGYKEEEVDEYLDFLTVELEKLISENEALKAEIERLNDDVEKLRGSEGAVLDTLEAAKALMGDISASAEKRAAILLKNAELDAELITREARETADRLKEESQSLESRYSSFRTRFRTLLETELEKFDSLSEELFRDMEQEKTNEDSKDTMGFAKAKPTVAADLRQSRETKALNREEIEAVIENSKKHTRNIEKIDD